MKAARAILAKSLVAESESVDATKLVPTPEATSDVEEIEQVPRPRTKQQITWFML